MRAAKKSCHGVYLLINQTEKKKIMLSKSDSRAPADILSPCVIYVGKLKNSAKRAISHVNAAVKITTSKNSKTVKYVRKLLKRGIDIGVVVVYLCNCEAAFGVESMLIKGFKHLVNKNRGFQHLKFPREKITYLTRLCLTYIYSKLAFNNIEYIEKSKFRK